MSSRSKILLLATALLMAFSPALLAQKAPADQSGQAKAPMLTNAQREEIIAHIEFNPRDISGVWNKSRANRGYGGTFPGKPSMTPWAQALFEKAKPTFGPRSVPVSDTTDPVYRCFPPGTPRIFFHPFPLDIIQTPGRVVMLFEYDHIVRQIFLTDKHPDDILPNYMGNSIGHWEGDTLVVDTIGFNGKTWVDREGHPSSTQLHVIEHIRRINFNTLQDKITIIDPKAYTKPWGGTFLFTLHPTWTVGNFECADQAHFLKFEHEELTPKEKKLQVPEN